MIPSELYISEDQTIPVIQRSFGGKLGEWNQETLQVGIEQDQPEPGKVLILIHEIMHMAECMAHDCGLIDSLPSEKYVETVSAFMFQFMAQSGMLTGCSPEDARAFVAESLEPANDHSGQRKRG